MGALTADTNRSFASRTVGNYMVFVHGTLAPSPSEWSSVIDSLRAHSSLSALKILVFTEGGAPNAAQRADLTAVLANKKLPIAVLTTSVIARAAGTALTWLNPGFRVFGPSDFDKALDYLGASGAERRSLRDAVEELKRVVAKRSDSQLAG